MLWIDVQFVDYVQFSSISEIMYPYDFVPLCIVNKHTIQIQKSDDR